MDNGQSRPSGASRVSGVAGTVSQFAEADYCYGVGPLRIRVERIEWAAPVLYDGENWYEVDGVEIGPNGVVIGRRTALVRGRRLPPPTPPAARRR
jgi:hypothetical protein